jgi:hypothetical protein
MRVGQRVHMPSSLAEVGWHTGTVSKVEAPRFQIVWDDVERHKYQPRVRSWFKLSQAGQFRFGNPGG